MEPQDSQEAEQSGIYDNFTNSEILTLVLVVQRR